MPRYICLLRAINVSGQRKIKMAELRDSCEEAGYEEVETYLQSGNLILTTKQSKKNLGEDISRLICDKFGYENVDILVRDPKEIAHTIKENPYAKDCDESKLYFTFLKSDAGKQVVKDIDAKKYAPDEFSIGKKVVYVHCPGGYGHTKINNSFFEKELKQHTTTRNWKTVNQLLHLSTK